MDLIRDTEVVFGWEGLWDLGLGYTDDIFMEENTTRGSGILVADVMFGYGHITNDMLQR